MDPKALAKSKRSHSRHHGKKSPHLISKSRTHQAASVETDAAHNPSEKLPKEKTHHSKPSPLLPSNWDRYGETSPDTAELPGNTASTSVVLPKSKGADYSSLISEARSEFRSDDYSATFASLDDVLPGFKQGWCSILSIRGQHIRSQLEDDNFIVDDGGITSHEHQFFSLNLHNLAERLGQVDLSKRLFIEEDLLHKHAFEGTSNEVILDQPERTKSEPQTRTPDSTVLCDINNKSIAANASNSKLPFSPESDDNPTAPRRIEFEAVAAEDELDMLLDSFSGSDIFESPDAGMRQSKNVVVSRERDHTGFNMGDNIDNLLEETSDVGLIPQPSSAVDGKSLCQISKKLQKSDDFDSWLDTISSSNKL